MTLLKWSTNQQRHSASGSQSTRLCFAAAPLLFGLLAREVSEARMQSLDYSEGCCWLQDYLGGCRSERFERSFVEEFVQIFVLNVKLKFQYVSSIISYPCHRCYYSSGDFGHLRSEVSNRKYCSGWNYADLNPAVGRDSLADWSFASRFDGFAAPSNLLRSGPIGWSTFRLWIYKKSSLSLPETANSSFSLGRRSYYNRARTGPGDED